MESKKGAEQLMMYVFYVIMIIFLLFALLYFTTNLVEKEGFKKQVIAKQTALLLDVVQPQTSISIETGKVSLMRDNGKIVAALEGTYSYDFNNPYFIEIVQTEEKTKIIIEE